MAREKMNGVIATIKSSGIKSEIEWIDYETNELKTKSGFTSSIDDFVIEDNIDYDSLRPQFAGMAMQGMWTGICGNLLLMEQMANRAVREGYKNVSEMVADDAVHHADSLIKALKKPREILKEKKETSNS